MSKLFFITVFTSFLAIGCGSGSTELLEKIRERGSLTVGTEGTYAPFTYHDERTGELTGFDVEIVREIGRRMGVEIEFLETSWDGLLTGVNSGRFDMVANQVWKKPAREEAYTLSDPYMLTNAVIVSTAEAQVDSLGAAAGKRAGHSLTSAYADMSREAGAEIVGVDSFTLAVENLKNGRIDYTINDTATVAFHLARYPDERLKAANLEADKYEVVLALPKKNAEGLVKEINRILTEMGADGSYERIYTRYFQVIK